MQEMARANEQENNLLNNTGIATLFLDEQMRVRRFTAQATELFKLIPGDVGRPITDLVTSLDTPALEVAAREVLRTLVTQEASVSAQGNRWYSVRTMPYRTRDNRIDGVVITFADVTTLKLLETSLKNALALLQPLGDVPQHPLTELRSLLERAASHIPAN
jgi:two-component system CheB/CheR fusion protein